MIDRFTAKAKEAIGLAVDAAEELGRSYVGTEHLLLGLLREGSCLLYTSCRSFRGDCRNFGRNSGIFIRIKGRKF